MRTPLWMSALATAMFTLAVSCAPISVPAPTATPMPSVALSPIPSSTATPAPTPTPTSTPTPAPSATPSLTASPTATYTPTRAPSATPTSTPRPTATLDPALRSGQAIERGGAPMVVVPAGEFLMGSRGDPYAFGHETPQRAVYLDAFWIDKHEVTNALYAQCVAAGACQRPRQLRSNTRARYYDSPEFGDYPVLYVSWTDARAFCTWSGKRLPSEAEWEKAARGPAGSIYPWGDAFDPARVNSAPNGPGDTTPVGAYPGGASVYGAHDMAGNVWEWVADFYQSDYYRIAPLVNPTGPAEGPPPTEAVGVMRGGAWNNNLRAVRGANRLGYFQRHVGFETGIRCVSSGR